MDNIMQRNAIAIEDFAANPLDIWNRGWFLLSSGDFASSKYHRMYFGEIVAVSGVARFAGRRP